MRHESHQSAYSDVDELDRPLSCGPVFRLRCIYPRFSSDFTCMCLRHTDAHSILNNTDFRKTFRFLAQPQIAVVLPSNSRAVSASKCRDANSASFHSDGWHWMLKENKYTSIIISTSFKEARSTVFPLLTRGSTVSSRPYPALLDSFIMASPCSLKRKVP